MSDTRALRCTVYRCSREPQMYFYLDSNEGLARIPEDLLRRAGTLSKVMTIDLVPERKLARAQAADVLAAIAQQGFYLQLPPDKQPVQFTMGE